MVKRTLVVVLMLAATAAYLSHASRAEAVPAREPLNSFPLRIAEWEGRAAPDFDPRVLSVLGVDDFVNRIYRRADSTADCISATTEANGRETRSIRHLTACLGPAGSLGQPPDGDRCEGRNRGAID